jgi:hypothetical protein
MNLANFEEQISSVILDRGRDYFESGYVTGLQQLSTGEWVAEIEGNYGNYNVEINLDDNGNIGDYSCNCPFDGPVCKHVAAVLLSIREEQKSAKLMTKAKKNSSEWEHIIANTPEKELRSFLLGFAKKNRELQDELVINLSTSPKKLDIPKYRKMIAHTFDATAGRHGFIEFCDAFAAMRPVYSLLEKADEQIQKGNLHEAFSIAAAVAPECLDALECMDDSNGQCGGAVTMAFETIDKILDVCNDEHLSNVIYDWLLEQVQNPDYDSYGCADELEPIFFGRADNPVRIEKAFQFLDKQLSALEKSNDWSSQYQQTKYLKYKIEFLEKEGKQDEADQIINSNLHLSDFMKMKIEQALSRNDYQAAIQYINDGIAQAEKDNHLGIVHQFKDQLLEIYQKQKDQKNIRKISRELFDENRNSINYYRIYKQTFEAVEWPDNCEEIIRKITKNRVKTIWGFGLQSDLADIFIEEQMWDRLFNEVKQANQIEITDKYSQHLKNDYPGELIILYRSSILKYAENTGRNIYEEIVRYLKRMAKLKGGGTVAKELMLELLEIYKKRPAMKDEFKKLNW